MSKNIFVSDLHGSLSRYKKLFKNIESEKPEIVFLGGDLFPHHFSDSNEYDSFYEDIFRKGFQRLKDKLKNIYPIVCIILGNDDGSIYEENLLEDEKSGLFKYIHNKYLVHNSYKFYGYNYIPPTPFQLKDWEKYDVSRHVDPGCVPIEEGKHRIEPALNEMKYSTIKKDLQKLVGDKDLCQSVFLFHSPPYKTKLDRAALDGKMIDYVPLDVHVGSIAIKRFIKKHQPLLTLHGHVHESASITGSWKDKIGNTFCFSAAHDGPELALIKFDLTNLEKSKRELI